MPKTPKGSPTHSKNAESALVEPTSHPERMSEPCHSFFNEHRKLDRFFHFVTAPPLFAAKRIRELVKQLAPGQEDEARYAENLKSADEIERTLMGYLPLLHEMLLCRTVDSYMKYLTDLLALIFRTRPETLKSGAQERLDFILQYSTMEDLVAALAEKRVQQLSYLGMRELSNQLSKDLGFALFESPSEMDTAVRIVETRNLIVHNRSVVNRLFLQRVSNSPAKLGEPIHLEIKGVFRDFHFIARSVARIDDLAANKFGVPQPLQKQQALNSDAASKT